MKYKYNGQWYDIYSSPLLNNLLIGEILQYAGQNIPGGYLLCDGSAISRTTYSELFDVIGEIYGSGDGSTTFNLPNLKGRVSVGLNSTNTNFNTLGKDGGEERNSFNTQHKHTVGEMITNTNATPGDGVVSRTNFTGGVVGTQDFSLNNLQPYLTINYIIRAKKNQSILSNVSSVLDSLTSNSTTDAPSINAVNERFTYSTEEKVIGTWIDGKPLYRKVFEYTLGSTTSSWRTIGTIPNIDFPVRMYGMFYHGNDKYPFPRSYNNEEITLYCDTSSKLFREQHNYSYANNLPSYVIIEYTKTTD